jgi:hypothetical protein
MEQANVRIRMNKLGDDVPLQNATPAELLILHVLHQNNNGGKTFADFVDKDGALKVENITEAAVDTGKKVLDKVIPAQPGRAAVPARAAIPARAEIPGRAAIGTPGKPGYMPAVEAIPAVEGIPAYEGAPEVKATPEQVVWRAVVRPRTDVEELRRLTAKYGHNVNKMGQKIVSLIWPDKMNPKLPQKFSELKMAEIQYDGTEVASLNYATGTPVKTPAEIVGAPA